eukprot:3757598-Pyramimonas_sp.AAC.1
MKDEYMYMEPTWTNEMAMIEMRLKWRLSFLLPIMALAAARVYSLVWGVECTLAVIGTGGP